MQCPRLRSDVYLMDAAYKSEVERLLAMLKLAIISCNRPDAEQCARRVEVMVKGYLSK